MNWQRTIGLSLAGIGLVVFALWFTQVNSGQQGAPGPQVRSPKSEVRGGPTNKVATAGGATNKTTAAAAIRPPAASPTNRVAGATNALALKKGATAPALKTGTNTPPALLAKFNQLRAHPAFYPVAAAVPLGLGVLFLFISSRSKKEPQAAGAAQVSTGGVKTARLARTRGRRAAAIHHCNVLLVGADKKQVWQFGARNAQFTLAREQATAATEPLPSKLIAKDWHNLIQPRLNIAWVPADQVFLRVIHLPQAEPQETLSMIEFQLEKLSPMPVAQIVWTANVMPGAKAGSQTLVITMVARAAVEEFLGKLEADGYLADRLELPTIDQLLATDAQVNGAWIYPAAFGSHNTALVAWFYGGVLRNLDIVTPAADDRAGSIKEQLMQMAWAGELEGWLTAPPTWHLVADPTTAAEWEPLLRAGLEQDIAVEPPLAPVDLAASTAARSAQSDPRSGLLPQEFGTRYQQQFVDRLWMRALGALVVLYLIGVGIYMTAVQVAAYRTRAVEQKVADLGPTYTNAMQYKAQFQVLKDRQELKFAALDCWKAVAELLPEEVRLEGFNFTEGRRLVLQGMAPMGQVQQVYQFEGAMRKVAVNSQALFDPTKGESLSYHTAPGGAELSWSFALELKRSEVQ